MQELPGLKSKALYYWETANGGAFERLTCCSPSPNYSSSSKTKLIPITGFSNDLIYEASTFFNFHSGDLTIKIVLIELVGFGPNCYHVP